MSTHDLAHVEGVMGGTAAGTPLRGSGPIATWVRTHPLVALFAWFFPVGWAIAFMPRLFPQSMGDVPFEVFVILATWIGLLLPVVVITQMVEGPAGLERLGRQIVKVRLGVGWYALAVLAVPALAFMLALLLLGPPDASASTVLAALSGGLLVQALLGFLTVNLWEEVAWMGFIQVRLQNSRGPLLAAVIAAFLFMLQHVPLLVDNAAGIVVALVFFIVAIPFRALVAWMFNRTGSLFIVGLLHAVGDATTSGSLQPGLLPRLYDDQNVLFLHMAALALIGLAVVITTRGHMGYPPRSS
jgi:membrane protease YdiL (CAAX protease family)